VERRRGVRVEGEKERREKGEERKKVEKVGEEEGEEGKYNTECGQ
jgi:hypothetical protein